MKFINEIAVNKGKGGNNIIIKYLGNYIIIIRVSKKNLLLLLTE